MELGCHPQESQQGVVGIPKGPWLLDRDAEMLGVTASTDGNWDGGRGVGWNINRFGLTGVIKLRTNEKDPNHTTGGKLMGTFSLTGGIS